MTTHLSAGPGVLPTEPDTRLWADLELLAPELNAKRGQIVQTMTDAFIGEVSEYYGELPERDQIVRTYDAHLDALLEAAHLPADQQSSAVRAVAQAQGRSAVIGDIPLAIQAEFYRLGLRALYEAMRPAVGDDASDLRMALALSAVWRLQDTWTQAMTSAYYRESREAIRWREQRRSALVATLLDGECRDSGELSEIAETLWLPRDSCYAVVALEAVGPCHKEIRVLETRLRRAGVPSAWEMRPDEHTVANGLVALGGSTGQRTLTEILEQTWNCRVGISPVFQTWDNASRAVRFARVAMSATPRGSRGVTAFDKAPVGVIAASAPDVLAEVGRIVLGSLNHLPEDDRQLLIGTLHKWLACGGSTEATAKAMFCHPNTIRYRLNRISDHTGRSLSDPLAVTELALALQGDVLSRCA